MSYTSLYQVFTFLFSLFQSFAVPMFIGVSGYGKAMLFLSPVFFFQSLIEPVFQSVFNKSGDVRFYFFSVFRVVAPFCLMTFLALVFVPLKLGAYELLVLFLYALFYFYSTAVTAFLFSIKSYRFVAFFSLIHLIVFVVSFFFMYSDFGYLSVLYGGLYSFLLSSFMSFFVLIGMGAISFKKEKSVKGFRFYLGASFFRAPSSFLNSGFVMLLGIFSLPYSIIGDLRIMLSVINAGRYVNLVPLAVVQKSISDYYYRDAISDSKRNFLMFSVSIFLYAFLAPLIYMYYSEFVGSDPYIGYFTIFFCCSYLFLQPVSYAFFCRMDSLLNLSYLSYFFLTLILVLFSTLLLMLSVKVHVALLLTIFFSIAYMLALIFIKRSKH